MFQSFLQRHDYDLEVCRMPFPRSGLLDSARPSSVTSPLYEVISE